jgi:hypothetical protein
MRRGEDRADPRTQEVLVWNDLLPRRLTLMNSPAAAHQKPRYKSVILDILCALSMLHRRGDWNFLAWTSCFQAIS